jgi:hypothetical protein
MASPRLAKAFFVRSICIVLSKTTEPTPKREKSRLKRANGRVFSPVLSNRDQRKLHLPFGDDKVANEISADDANTPTFFGPHLSGTILSTSAVLQSPLDFFLNSALEHSNHFDASRRQSFFAEQNFEPKQQGT